MAQFTLYNYEFGKIKNLESADLFGNTAVLMDAEEAFPQRQQILDDILKRDYERSKEITFVNNYNNKEYGHMHMMAPTDGMAVMCVRDSIMPTGRQRYGKTIPIASSLSITVRVFSVLPLRRSR